MQCPISVVDGGGGACGFTCTQSTHQCTSLLYRCRFFVHPSLSKCSPTTCTFTTLLQLVLNKHASTYTWTVYMKYYLLLVPITLMILLAISSLKYKLLLALCIHLCNRCHFNRTLAPSERVPRDANVSNHHIFFHFKYWAQFSCCVLLNLFCNLFR